MKKSLCLFLVIVVIVISIIGVSIFCISTKSNNQEKRPIETNKQEETTVKVSEKTEQVSEIKKKFSEEILGEFTKLGNVYKDNLKEFNIRKILHTGYYASRPEEKYYQIEFSYECKDGSTNCIKLNINDDQLYGEDGYYVFSVIAKDYKVIKFMAGVSININSNFVSEAEEIK